MPVENPYNPNPTTADSLFRQRQTQADLNREKNIVPPEPQAPQPDDLATHAVKQWFGDTVAPEDKSFLRKVGEDAAVLSYAIPVGLTKIATGLVTHPIDTLKEVGGGFMQSGRDLVDPEYYKAHPLLGVVNAWGIASPVASIVKSSGIKMAMRAALDTGIKEAVAQGIKEDVVKTALTVGMKDVGGLLVNKGAFGTAVFEAAKTGKVGLVSEVVRGLLVKGGIADEAAIRIASTVSDNLYTSFSRQTTKMKIADAVIHPLGTVTDYVGSKLDPIRTQLFGNPAETAVAKLYGAETVAKNPEGFVAIEQWAAKQLGEQGLENSLANRQRVMQQWVDQSSSYAALTPEQRIAHFNDYAQSDLTRLKIHDATGIDIVTVKALPQNYVDAAVQTVKDSVGNLDVAGLTDLAKEVLGSNFKDHTDEITSALTNNGTKEGLIDALTKMGNPRSSISFAKFSPDVQKLASELENTGYRIGHAPTNKPVSFVSDIIKEKTSVVDEAYQSTRKNGGVTISLNGDKPITGFVYAPFKGTEFSVPEAEFTSQHVSDFIAKNIVELSKEGNNIGIWVDNGKVYLDVSRVGEASAATLQEAMNGSQLAVYDLGLGKSIPLGEITNGVYTKIDEATNIFNKYNGENATANSTGNLGGISEVPTSKPGISETGAISTGDILAKRTAFGNWIDKLGLSPDGTIEGAAEFAYRENFTQNVLGKFAEKYGNIIKAKSITGNGMVSIPVEKLFEWLDKNKSVIRGIREKLTLPVRTVFDLKEGDLIRAGFSKEIAADIVDISKKSLYEVPASVTGMGDKVVNFLRTRSAGYNAWMSNVYDTYLKVAYKGRYDLSPFFSAQEFIETKLNSALFLKDPSLLAGGRTLQSLGSWTAEKLSNYIGKETGTYLREIVTPPPLNDVVAVRDEILGTLQKTMLDYTSSPDIIGIQNAAQGIKGLAGEAAFEQSIKSRNLWYGLTGQSSVRIATVFNKAIAEKFGMSLESALGFTMENGVKKYTNPQMVQMMREATQEVFHYKPGFLTSPLVKTMNLVWFPFRFETKTVSLLSKYVSNLSPASRLVVLNNWVHFANWAGTDEGINWRRTNRNMLYNVFSYVTAYEQMGQGLEAVAKGRLFGGNAGLIGAVPFGFAVNLARELAILPSDQDQFDAKTGRRFTKEIPRNIVSAAAFSNAVEQLLISISPSTPFYSLTGGVISGISPGKIYTSLVRQVVGAGKAAVEGKDISRGKQLLERDFKRVPLEYSRIFQ